MSSNEPIDSRISINNELSITGEEMFKAHYENGIKQLEDKENRIWSRLIVFDLINELATLVRNNNEKWWVDINTGEPLQRNKGELLALIHSEISECLEGVRKNLKDDHLPHRTMEEVELADAVIRILDYAGGCNLDLGGAIKEKLEYNKNRADHKIENRLKDGGKKF